MNFFNRRILKIEGQTKFGVGQGPWRAKISAVFRYETTRETLMSPKGISMILL